VSPGLPAPRFVEKSPFTNTGFFPLQGGFRPNVGDDYEIFRFKEMVRES
jgi:hypothetical protein